MRTLSSLTRIRIGLIAVVISSLTACIEIVEEEEGEGALDVQIHWLPVTEFSDGSAITSIDHYQIHYGQETDQLDQVAISRTPNITSYIIKDLEAGEYYFAMVAVAENGEQSEISQPSFFQVSE
jgi:hypothetical protein